MSQEEEEETNGMKRTHDETLLLQPTKEEERTEEEQVDDIAMDEEVDNNPIAVATAAVNQSGASPTISSPDPGLEEHQQRLLCTAANHAIVIHCANLDDPAKNEILNSIITTYNNNNISKDMSPENYIYMHSKVFVDSLSLLDVKFGWKLGIATLINLVRTLEQNIRNSTPSAAITTRIALLDFQIVDSRLSHPFDVQSFIDQVLNVQQTWDSYCDTEKEPKIKSEDRYDAPYFCFIQSSGMGKTKIMYEAVLRLNQDKNWACALIIPTGLEAKATEGTGENKVFQHKFTLPTVDVDATVGIATDCGFKELDELFKKILLVKKNVPLNESSPVLLCFDESQVYLDDRKFKNNGQDKSEKAYWFRVIRLWLRRKRARTVVAVFAGTTASINGFRFQDEESTLAGPHPSREWTDNVKLHTEGDKLFPVFSTTTTIGCLAGTTTMISQTMTDYQRAIPYGRPLFALLEMKSMLDQEKLLPILGRMLQVSDGSSSWETNDKSLMSILATRVQMGQITFEIASVLVSKGYANLVGLSNAEKQARITYMPDPVCAQLAMGMMTDSFQLGEFRGKGQMFWAEKMSMLFQRGLCTPDKGDTGEIFVALYFLLCGDMLRKKASTELTTFSIRLKEWIHLLKSGGRWPAAAAAAATTVETVTHDKKDDKITRRSDRQAKLKQKADDASATAETGSAAAKQRANKPLEGCTVQINFIQVCRNNLRNFGWDWAGFEDQRFLDYLFQSAIAFYVYPGCPLIDFAAPIKINVPNEKPYYIPLLVSIKSRDYVGPGDAAEACEAMVNLATCSRLKSALCLFVVFGSSIESDDSTRKIEEEESIESALLNDKIVAKVLRIPSDDEFTLSKQFQNMTSAGLEKEELLASHAFIRAFHGHEEELNPAYALRAKPTDEARTMLIKLKEQLARGAAANNDEATASSEMPGEQS